MDDLFAKTIKALASDIDRKWNVKKGYDDDDIFLTHAHDLPKRLLPPIPVEKPNPIPQQTASYSPPVSNVDRLRKTASVWFQPKYTRLQTEDILKNFEIGIFIVRMNSDNITMVLSYNFGKKVVHLKIKVDHKKGFFIDGSTKIFKNIHVLLDNYFINPIFDPDIKLKLPRILMELTHPSHFKFFENLKSDFWVTQICQLKLNEIFVDSLIDVNYDSKLQKKDYQESTLSLPGLKLRKKQNTEQAYKYENKRKLNIFKKVKSKICKDSTSSTEACGTNPNARRKSFSLFSVHPPESKNLKYVSGIACDLDDYDYDE